jgi:hypothetical protein
MTRQCWSAHGVFALARGRPLVKNMRAPTLHRLVRVTASMLSAVVLVLLPKCPLCLAAWLTVVTGVGFSAAGAAWVRGSFVLLWALIVAPMVWRRAFRREPALS